EILAERAGLLPLRAVQGSALVRPVQTRRVLPRLHRRVARNQPGQRHGDAGGAPAMNSNGQPPPRDVCVSVVIPAYNAARHLPEPPDSALPQPPPPHEIPGGDDGSTDAPAAVLPPSRDRLYVLKQENQGVSAARNAALERATGEWVAYLDADDR